jgi:class 3 adenylate cyclase
LVPLEGDIHIIWLGDTEPIITAIDDFLSGYEGPRPPSPVREGLQSVLFTDMEGSTALRQRLGDAKAQDLVRTHNTIVRDALKAHSGSEIKHTGDGIMASFSTASGALECAVAIQRGVAAHVEQHPDAPLGVYIGLNAGEPIAEEKDLFGTSVDLTRRICDNAQPGQILVSDLVAGLAAGKGFVFEDQGEASLKGFDRPVRLYEVRWREED